MKTAFLFSGQGAQYVGMGKELYEKFEICKEVFEKANDVLKLSITDICFYENEKINQTEFTQPAILTVSTAIFKLLEQKNIKPDYLAGLSLGEYSALVASKAITFEDAVKLVKNRGEYMANAVPSEISAMSAILSLGEKEILEACNQASNDEHKVMIANYNAPGQIVIAGHKEAVEKAEKIVKEKGAKRAIRLNVSGPFHTPLLKTASEKLKKDLKNIKIEKMETPVITNLTADVSLNENLIDTLTKQVVSPVKWEQTINKLIELGVHNFIEVGPGKVLTSFVKKVDKNVQTYNVENVESLEKTCKGLGIC